MILYIVNTFFKNFFKFSRNKILLQQKRLDFEIAGRYFQCIKGLEKEKYENDPVVFMAKIIFRNKVIQETE
jgi:hypothetical protein